MTETKIHSQAEELAAFVDGRLAGSARQRVVDHLADCSECYEVFVETTRFLDEERKGGVLPWPGARPSWWRRRGAMTAAAGVAAIALLVLVRGGGGPLSSAATLVAALNDEAADKSAADMSLLASGGGVLRFAPSTDGDVAARRLGAQFLEIHVGLRAGQPDAAATAAAGLAEVLAGVGRTGDERAARQLAEALAAGLSPEDARRDTERLARQVARGFSPSQLAFGAGADAGRRAAAAGDAAFFSGEPYRAWRRAIDERTLPPDAAPLLADIDRALADGLERPSAGPSPRTRSGYSPEGAALAIWFRDLILIE